MNRRKLSAVVNRVVLGIAMTVLAVVAEIVLARGGNKRGESNAIDAA
jgi:hypothetical protein